MKQDEYESYINFKINSFSNNINNTLKSAYLYKQLGILGISDQMYINKKCNEIKESISNCNVTEKNDNTKKHEEKINHLQTINNEFSGLFKKYGTYYLDSLIDVCFGNMSDEISKVSQNKVELFRCFFRPKNASNFASISGGLLEGFWAA